MFLHHRNATHLASSSLFHLIYLDLSWIYRDFFVTILTGCVYRFSFSVWNCILQHRRRSYDSSSYCSFSESLSSEDERELKRSRSKSRSKKSSESSSSDDERDSKRSRSKSRSKKSKKDKKHRSRAKHSSSDSENDGPLPLSRFFGAVKSWITFPSFYVELLVKFIHRFFLLYWTLKKNINLYFSYLKHPTSFIKTSKRVGPVKFLEVYKAYWRRILYD